MRVLIVDAMPLVYASFAKVGHLSVQNGPHRGTPTGLRYQFLRTIRSYRERTSADRVVIAWDTPHPVLKAGPFKDLIIAEQVEGGVPEVEAQETYKAGRAATIEQGTTGKVDKRVMYDQIPALKEMIGLTSWAQIEAPGYEADDIVGALARQLSEQGHRIIISSTDNDLAQVVNDEIWIFAPKTGKGKDAYKDPDWVQGEFGCHGPNLVYYRAVVGDKSDNLPGMQDRCKRKFDLDHVRRVCQSPGLLTPDNFIALLPGEQQLDIQLHRAYFDALVTIMSLHTPPKEERVVTNGLKDQAKLQALFEILEFNSLMDKIPELCS